ncbi:hypothetical protein RJ640_025739 [Escallonia rubra]|uniref:Chlororespiratory reduction 4 n=1 Tax=Escallonia rubra TaxID=112253 RepID=A0AA88RL36_9ASTE|nr:hypothetical protein RJ640_025739 [Escallonia rubra]
MYVSYKFSPRLAFKNFSLFRFASSNGNSLYEWNTQITNCFKRGDIKTAVQVFDEMPQKNVVTWNCMVSGYVHNGRIPEARKVFNEMPSRNVVSWTALLSGYARCGRVEEARGLFEAVPDKNVACWNAMLSGYVRNGQIVEARALFNAMPMRNSVSWGTMVEGYFSQGLVSEAELLFGQARVKSVSLCNTMLAGYAAMGCYEASYELFTKMARRDVASWTSMINCCCRAGRMEKALNIFQNLPQRDVVAWTVMVQGYVRSGQIEEARKLFSEMPRRDIVAWNSMIGGYVQNGRLGDALELFRKMPRTNIVTWNTLLLGYVRQDDMVGACQFFQEMPRKDITSWNTMIAGYPSEEALILYLQMLQAGLRPDQGTFTCVISVCGTLAVHGWGRATHTCVIKSGYENDTLVITSFISMYSKCGFMNDAALVFGRMTLKDTVAWNSMIVAHAYHGSVFETLNLFHCMIEAGFKPDHATFLCVLSACAHSGLVDKSWIYFRSMESHWNLIPKAEHYACIIDLLGRSGKLAEAYQLVKQLPVDNLSYDWEALLSSCRVHDNFELGDLVAQNIFGGQPFNVGMSVLLSNIYAARGMWEDAAKVRASLKRHGVKKELACSWIEMKAQVCPFVYNDKTHPQIEDIYVELESLSEIIKDIGANRRISCNALLFTR